MAPRELTKPAAAPHGIIVVESRGCASELVDRSVRASKSAVRVMAGLGIAFSWMMPRELAPANAACEASGGALGERSRVEMLNCAQTLSSSSSLGYEAPQHAADRKSVV